MVLLQLMPVPLNCSQCHEDVAKNIRQKAILYKVPKKCVKHWELLKSYKLTNFIAIISKVLKEAFEILLFWY